MNTSAAPVTKAEPGSSFVLPKIEIDYQSFGRAIEDWAAETAPEGYYFDEVAAEKAANFFPTFLRHTTGRWAGQPFHLDEWQRAVVRCIFGWKRPDGTRRFRQVFIEIGRKNGKTSFAAGIALYMTFCDGEAGAQVYSVANDKDQAKICFAEAVKMRGLSDALRKRSIAYKTSLVVGKMGASFKPLSSIVKSKHGFNTHCAIYDEVHEFKSRDLHDVIHTSTGSRTQPLEIEITTAGEEGLSIWAEHHEYAEKVRDQIINDPDFLPVLFCADKDDDWTAPETWLKANPGLGRTISVEYIAKECARAQVVPGFKNTFLRLHLNVRTEKASKWLSMQSWDDCDGAVIAAELEGRECYGGLDLSSKSDLTALALIFPPIEEGEPWKCLVWCWCPADNIKARADRDRVPYPQWRDEGLLEATEGNVVDYDLMRARISGADVFRNLSQLPGTVAELVETDPEFTAIAERFDIQEIAYDRWNSSQLVNQLVEDGHTMVPFGQGYASMAAPTKELGEKLIPGGQLAHGGNKLLRWCASNIKTRQDPAGNLKPDREKSSEKIDPMVALIMALGRAMLAENDETVIEYTSGQMFG